MQKIQRKIIKISELNRASRQILEANFGNVWVEGEISNFVIPSSGHIYFSLKDKAAQARCVMFRTNNQLLGFKPKNGDHVIVEAQVSLYEPRGDYQLIVSYMELAGSGILHEKFLALKNKLEKEGLFAEVHKKAIPEIPKCIGVITSPTGAAIQDILTVLKRRFPSIPIIIYPTQVQGEFAASQIVTALHQANLRDECDVLILARGGGAIEDLWPFNEEIVARAIYSCSIPIISAVGHEIDFTIADFVADVRAPTPSAAAELAVPDMQANLKAIEHWGSRLLNLIEHRLEMAKWELANLKNRLRHPREILSTQTQRIDELEHRLRLVMKQYLENLRYKLSAIAQALNLISPLKVLDRGFAIITKEDHVLTSSQDAKCGDKIKARLAVGSLECVVEKTNKN